MKGYGMGEVRRQNLSKEKLFDGGYGNQVSGKFIHSWK